jgi:hypothetical protein
VPIVQLEISPGSITVRVLGRGLSRRWPDQVTTVDDTIVDIGDQATATERVQWRDRARTCAAFETEAFEPEVAAAAARYHTLRAISDAYPAWRSLFRVRGVSVDWPAWPEIPPAERSLFVERVAESSPTVVVNGSPLVRPRIDLPILELVFGRSIRRDVASGVSTDG